MLSSLRRCNENTTSTRESLGTPSAGQNTAKAPGPTARTRPNLAETKLLTSISAERENTVLPVPLSTSGDPSTRTTSASSRVTTAVLSPPPSPPLPVLLLLPPFPVARPVALLLLPPPPAGTPPVLKIDTVEGISCGSLGSL